MFSIEKQVDVAFFCSSLIDETWIRSTIFKCKDKGLKVKLQILHEANDQKKGLRIYNEKGIAVQTDNNLTKLARQSNAKAVVTASSGINREIFPTKAEYLIHMPHSLASLHKIYPDGSFDGYDILFACGPHHVEEFKKIKERDGEVKSFKIFNIGYGKGDLIRNFLVRQKNTSEQKKDIQILFAASWGGDNLINYITEELVEQIINEGSEIVTRPHPLTFLEDKESIIRLKKLESTYDKFIIEDPSQMKNSLYTADLLVGDYSGISFEYAAYRGRKVISVDVGEKIANKNWKRIDLPAIETSYRRHIGCIANKDSNSIYSAIRNKIKDPFLKNKDTKRLFLYDNENETCAERAADRLVRLVK